MKKVKILLCLLFLFSLLSVIANAETYGDLTYEISNGEVTITDCNTSATSVTIPSTIGGFPVTSIGMNAFSNCRSLTGVTIPEGVTSISNFAFSFCSSLTSLTIPEGVTSIGFKAIIGCSSLTGIWVDENNTKYCSDEYGVLFNKDKTTLICHPASTSLTYYVIPDSVISISAGAFYECSSLTSITIPEGVTSIADNAFGHCRSLTSLTIPDSVKSISNFVFSGCSSLTGIWVDENNTKYCSDEYGVLFNKEKTTLICHPANTSLTYYVIPDSVTSISTGAFYECSSLTWITIPDSVTSIDMSVFYGCSSLMSITLSEGVTSIGNYAFQSCSSLMSISIPSSVISIGNYAFAQCEKIESIIIPSSVTDIGDYAFRYCSILTIYGYTNSTAETYATDNEIPFKVLDTTKISGKSLYLDGGIGVKVHFEYNADVVSIDDITAQAIVTNSDTGSSDTVNLELFESADHENTVYGIIEVSPKDYKNITMNVTVSAQGSSAATGDLKVCDIINEYQTSATVSTAVVSLVNALESYCEQADIFFNNKTAKEITLTAEEESALTMPALTGDKVVGNLTFYASTLILKSKVTLRHYFTIDGEFNPSDYTVDGAEVYDRGDGYAYLEIANINASELHNVKKVVLEKGDSKIVLSFSPLNYVTLNYKSTDTRLANIVKALYKYSIESKNYLNPEITYPLEEDEIPRVQW